MSSASAASAAAGWFRRLARAFGRAPGFFLVAVLTLAVGIGATAAIFTVVNAVLLAPLPYPEPERIVAVSHLAPGLGVERFEMSDGIYFIYQRYNRSLDSLGIYWEGSVTLTGGEEPARVGAAGATAGVFSALRIPPAHGRPLQEADEQPGAEPVVVLSHGLWRRRFGGSPSAVGSTLQVDRVAHRIVGVMPPGLRFPSAAVELWVPMTIDPADLGAGNFAYRGVARLRPGVTPERAARELSDLLWRIPELPTTSITPEILRSSKLATRVVPLRHEIVGEVRRVLWVLLGSAGLILLIACANVANLFLVRTAGRQREVAVRAALGASRRDIVRLFLGESLALALTAGALGLALAAAGVRALAALRPAGLPRLEEIAVNGTVVAFTVAVALLTGLLVGLFAALRQGRPQLAPALQEEGRGGTAGRESLRAQSALVVVQVALSLVLLVAAGLMIQSFRRLGSVDPGIDPRRLLTLQLNLPEPDYQEPQEVARFVLQLLEKVRALPGVQAAGTSSQLPLTPGDSDNGHVIEDFPPAPGEAPPLLATRWVSPEYFATMRIPLLQGRTFDRLEPDALVREAVVSQALAERFWPGRSPLGKRLAMGFGDHVQWATIVGVVAGSRDNGLHAEPVAAVYYPMQPQVSFDPAPRIPRSFALAVRSSGDPLRLVAPVRDAVRSLDPHLPLAQVQTMEEVVERSLARTTFTMLLLGIAGLVALVLGAVGIYAVLSSVVSRRTREIGVRRALGAERSDIARMVLREGLGLTLVGIAAGLLGAFAATRLMVALLFEVSPTDPLTFAAVPALLAAIALFACWMPARRAAKVPPLEAIRNG
jgi:putative ABC transport system permease protein